MKSSWNHALILSLAALFLVGSVAWAGEEEENVWVTDAGHRMALHGHGNAMFISDDGETFDLSDLLQGQSRAFGEGDKQVTASRDGDIVTINRVASGDEKALEIQCHVDTDTCQVMTFEEDPEKVMIVVTKTRECVNGIGDCEATVDISLDRFDIGEGGHAIIRKVKCDDTGNCEEFEDVHVGSAMIEVIADMEHGNHPNIMVMHAGEMDGKVKLVCPEGDSTVRVDAEQADDTFLCPQHSVPMEQATEHKFIRKIELKEK